MRALRLLARREHSRAELAAKLKPHAADAAAIESVLGEFEAKGWLSEPRFVDAVLSARRQRFGTARVVDELQRKGVSPAQLARARDLLAQDELATARAVWGKKFHALPANLSERARQARFLASRGFSAEIVKKVLNGRED